jgi:hypothetical protein
MSNAVAFPEKRVSGEPWEFLLRVSRNDDGTIFVTLNGKPIGDVETVQIAAALIENVRARYEG